MLSNQVLSVFFVATLVLHTLAEVQDHAPDAELQDPEAFCEMYPEVCEEMAMQMENEKEKRARSMIRFGKRKSAYFRFGKRKSAYFRFGKRHADEQPEAAAEAPEKRKTHHFRFGK